MVQEVAQGISDVSSSISHLAESGEESQASVTSLRNRSGDLRQLAAQLQQVATKLTH